MPEFYMDLPEKYFVSKFEGGTCSLWPHASAVIRPIVCHIYVYFRRQKISFQTHTERKKNVAEVDCWR